MIFVFVLWLYFTCLLFQVDEEGINPVIRVWNLDKRDKLGNPFCCRVQPTIPASNVPTEVCEMFTISSPLSSILKFDNSAYSVIFLLLKFCAWFYFSFCMHVHRLQYLLSMKIYLWWLLVSLKAPLLYTKVT